MADRESRRNPRLRLSCARCQRRKIRCDRRYPICSNCGKASAECVDGDSLRLRPSPRDHTGERGESSLKERIKWLEAIVRERLPDVDLAAGPETSHAEADTDASPSQQPGQEDSSMNPVAPVLPAGPTDQRTHEIGLIAVAANADQQYIGPSSGYFLARLLLACSPPREEPFAASSRDVVNMNQDIINDLIEAFPGPLPLPKRSLVDRLAQVYFNIVHPQWPVLHEPSFRAVLDQIYSNEEPAPDVEPTNPYSMFQIFMVLAISATILSFQSRRQVSGESYCLSALKYFDRLNTQTSLPGLQCLLLLLIFSMHSPHIRLNVWYLNYQCIARVLDLGLQRNVTASTGISLLNQEMRTRVFWVVFTLDRTIATMMGRPIGLRDEACELRLPQYLEDYELVQNNYPIGQSGSMKYSVHLFKLAKINSEIKYVANSIVRDAPAYAYPPTIDLAGWQHDMLTKLNQWAVDIPRQDTGNRYMERICEIRCSTIKMLLLRPSPAIIAPSPEMLMVCNESARQAITLYEQLYREDLLVHDWITLHGIVLATITMMYCIRTVVEIARSTEPEVLMGDMNICLSVLSATGEHWAGAKRSRQVLDDLGKSTLAWIKRAKALHCETGADSSGPMPEEPVGAHPPFNQSDQVIDTNLPFTFANTLGHSADEQTFSSFWLASNHQQHAFTGMTNVDDIMRNLFDGFIPQVDAYDIFQGF